MSAVTFWLRAHRAASALSAAALSSGVGAPVRRLSSPGISFAPAMFRKAPSAATRTAASWSASAAFMSGALGSSSPPAPTSFTARARMAGSSSFSMSLRMVSPPLPGKYFSDSCAAAASAASCDPSQSLTRSRAGSWPMRVRARSAAT